MTLLWAKSGPPQAQGSTYWPQVDPATGEIWVSSPFDNKFWIFKPDGTYVRSWGAAGTGDGQLDLISHVRTPDGVGAIAFAPDGTFFVADEGNHRVQKFDKNGKYLLQWGGFGTADGQLPSPKAIATDGKVVYVGDDSRGDLQVFDLNGRFLRKFELPFILFGLGPNGHIYAKDDQGIAELDDHGKLVAEHPVPESISGPEGGVAQVQVDKTGRIYVLGGDASPFAFFEIEPNGTIRGPWAGGGETFALSPDLKAIYVAYSRGLQPAGTDLKKYALP